MPIGIVVALRREAYTLGLNKVVMGEVVDCAGVQICVSGMGAAQAERAAEALIAYGANSLVSWGCAGALVEGLSAGDLLMPCTVRGADGIDYAVDEVWRSKVLQALHSLQADERAIAESHTFLSDSAAKQSLAASSKAAAVDMESAAVLRVAQQHGLPALVLRAVADTLHDKLPACLDGTLNPVGDLLAWRFAAKLLRRPADIFDLIPLQRRFARASATLRQARRALQAQLNA